MTRAGDCSDDRRRTTRRIGRKPNETRLKESRLALLEIAINVNNNSHRKQEGWKNERNETNQLLGR